MSETIGPTRANIVEKVLEQGQRLRNAMVKSILDNDPHYVDVDKNMTNNSHLHKGKRIEISYNQTKISESDLISDPKQKATAALNPDWYDSSPPDSFPRMSGEFCDLYCVCEICKMYRSQSLWARTHLTANSANEKVENISSLDLARADKTNVHLGPAVSSYDSEVTADWTMPHYITSINLPKDTNLASQKEETKNGKVQSEAEEITKSIQYSYRCKAIEYFKYVNSLKITIHSLTLNQAGNRKVSVSSVDSKYKLPTSISHSYFIEYSIPDCLMSAQVPKTRSKVDSGLSANIFRICSKKLQNEEIYFKHTSVHDIISLRQLNLRGIQIRFQVSCRTMKQKRSNILGYMTFNMSMFEVTKHLSCAGDFPIINEEEFTLGSLKMTLQLGCGRMYFGKEFVEFVINNMKASGSSEHQSMQYDTLSTKQADSVIFVGGTVLDERHDKIATGKSEMRDFAELLSENPSPSMTVNRQQSIQSGSVKRRTKEKEFVREKSDEEVTNSNFVNGNWEENTNFLQQYRDAVTTRVDNNRSLLYGLLYVSEAQYFEGSAINSYLSCRVFCQGDILCSRVVYNSKEPVFNFYQKVPFLFNDALLVCMRDNSIVVDFWERYEDEDVAIGNSQLPLHQFYIAYRNKIIADTLLQDRLPVTISDWWEPICSPVNGKVRGQMKVLVAVGTASQIHNLEVERGLKDNSITVTYVPIVPEAHNLAKKRTHQSVQSFRRPDYLAGSAKGIRQKVLTTSVKGSKKAKDILANNLVDDKDDAIVKIDIGIQSDLDMESRNKYEAQDCNKTQNLLEAFLSQLIGQKQKNVYVENATNTENTDVPRGDSLTKTLIDERSENSVTHSLGKLNRCKNATNTQLRKTSDLLDYLNRALSTEDKATLHATPQPSEDKNNFKAHVIVEGALHLPCRRKCKSKRTRRRNISYEEALPNTYVTFETVPGADLKIGPVVPRSASPQWDFRCDVLLPGEILTNSQKRLIFKVWRKSNEQSPHPNLQTDVILGFAALDLTVLLAGLPSVQGWFNIVDFSSKCNGQIKIHVTPLENILRFAESQTVRSVDAVAVGCSHDNNCIVERPFTKNKVEVKEEPSELLNRALKRKFSELEEITQRLRSRLADVTRDESDTSNDEFDEEFERDINTLCVEDDYDMINLDAERTPRPFSGLESRADNYLLKEVEDDRFSSAEPSLYSKGTFRKEHLPNLASNDSAYGSAHISDKTEKIAQPIVAGFSSTSSNAESQILQINSPTPGDAQLIAGKHRIDALLEKLTLLSGTDTDHAFPSRYVSGCSVNREVSACIDGKSGHGLSIDAILNPALFNQLCSFEIDSTPSLTTEPSERLDSSSNAQIDNNSSGNSLLTQFSTCRQAPDGAGNSVDGNSNNINNKQKE